MTQTDVLAEMGRMAQQHSEMLAEVKSLKDALNRTAESQHVTRATLGKVVVFLQHMHGGPSTHPATGGEQGVLLRGPGPDSPVLPSAKRSRLQLTDQTPGADVPNLNLTGAGLPGTGHLGVAHGAPGGLAASLLADGLFDHGPLLGSVHMNPLLSPGADVQLARAASGGQGAAIGGMGAVAPLPLPATPLLPPAAPLFTPETLDLSRKISRQISNGDDIETIDIESVLDLLSGIEQHAGGVPTPHPDAPGPALA
jgi:hypothetical protein